MSLSLTEALKESRVVTSQVNGVRAVVVRYKPGSPHYNANLRYGVAVVVNDGTSRCAEAHSTDLFHNVGLMLANTGVRFKDWEPFPEHVWDAIEARNERVQELDLAA